MAEIFRAYDIRGVYPDDLNEELAYKIGRAFVKFLNVEEVLVGRDGRLSSPSLFDSLVKGIIDEGADVIDIGLASTPMFYFAASHAKSGIMITASHNPKQYNGFKMCGKNVSPIGELEIKEIKKIVEGLGDINAKKGKIIIKNVLEEFINFNLGFMKTSKKFKIVVDAGNAMGGFTFPKIFERLEVDFIPLYCNVDFNFPNHEANPLNFETLKDLQRKVVEENADIGIALDGDGDRCFFIDEKGEIINCDLITALIAGEFLKENPECTILYDLRSSKIVPEYIELAGGNPMMCRVGHTFIKKQMREQDALFAGELSGHFYYKDHFFTESTFMTTAFVLNLMGESGKQLSELIKGLKKYFSSEEINSEVENKEDKIKEIEDKFKDGKIVRIDGLSVYYDDWWFNLRMSNTEPLLRLNVEANTKGLMEEKRDELLEIIRSG